MGTTPARKVSSEAELEEQLRNPTPDIVRARALEVLGNNEKATRWLSQPRPIFDDHSPNDLIATGDPEKMREVLGILLRVEFGVYS